MAGSETTASLLSGLLMWLLRTPQAHRRLVQEIRERFPAEEKRAADGTRRPRDMTFLALQELPYMNACIDEALRIFPPVPTGLTRTVPAGGDTVAGEPLPGGTTVSVYSWAAAHAPANFTRPDDFVPERWLEGSPEARPHAADRRDASQAFSLGPRGCIGKHLSYLELRLILANLLWFFDVERADLGPSGFDVWDTDGDLKHVKAFNTWNKPPLMCRLRPVRRN